MKKIIYILLFIISISYVNGVLTDASFYWTLDNDKTSFPITEDSSINNKDGAMYGEITSGQVGKYGEAFSFNGINQYILSNFTNYGSVSCFQWIKQNDADRSAGDSFIHKDNYYINSNYRDFWFCNALDGTNKISLYVWNTGGTMDSVTSGSAYSFNSWSYLGFTYNNATGNMSIYLNSSIIASKLHTSGGNIRDSIPRINLYRTQDDAESARYVKGLADEVVCYNRVLSISEIQTLMNSGNPFGSTPSLVINTNMINKTINYNELNLNISFNGTMTATGNIFNCSLFVNNTLNQTQNNINLSANQNFNYLFGEVESWLRFKINCSNNNASAETQEYFYRVDTIIPQIATDFINNSNYTQLDNIPINVNFTDSNLFAYNISIFDINGVEQENIYAENLTQTFAKNETTRVATTVGNYTIRFSVWDSHTKIRIPSYYWEKIQYTLNNITYKGIRFDNNLELITDDYSKLSDFALIKNSDRFLFAFNFTQTNFIFSMFIKADNIKYLPESNYKGHFIINNKHWVDFESNDISNLQIDYLVNYGVWRIRFIPNKKIVVFNSIGDLNYNEAKYYYTIKAVSSGTTVDLTVVESLLNETLQEVKKTNKVNNTMYIIIPLIPLILGIFLMIGAVSLSDEHSIIKIFMFLAAFFSIIISLNYASIILNYSVPELTEMQDQLGQGVYIVGWVFFILLMYFIVYFIYKTFKTIRQDKEDKLNY